ncbi:MAG: hypothetical protein AAF754_09540 [Pseudomonadota bacterium]
MSKIQVLADAGAGLALEAEMLAGAGHRVAIWSAQARGIVCPRTLSRKARFDAAAALSASQGWPLHLRPTGGGAVPQGPGVVNLALVFDAPTGFTIEDAYRHLTRQIVQGLGEPAMSLKPGDTPGSFCDGVWNLSCAGRKVVGTAQRWRSRRGATARVLAHAMILTDARFRPGAAAVANLHTALGLGVIDVDVHTDLQAAFGMRDVPFETLYEAACAPVHRGAP